MLKMDSFKTEDVPEVEIKIERYLSNEENEDPLKIDDSELDPLVDFPSSNINRNCDDPCDAEGDSCLLKVEEETLEVNIVTAHHCKQCNVIYDGLASFEVHLETKHGCIKNVAKCRKLADKASSEPHSQSVQQVGKPSPNPKEVLGPDEKHTTENKNFRCSVCSWRFSRKHSLKTHMMTHTGEKPFECNICDMSFNRKGHLQRHKLIHAGIKPYKCEMCSSCFVTNGELKTHTMTHTGEKPYKCDVCTSSFASSGNLNSHKKIHTGEKPYDCDICDCKFITKSAMNRHKIRHTGERPYKCDDCSSCFVTSGELRKHQKTHSGENSTSFKCDICTLSFFRKGFLTRHMVVHAGEKPYKCEVCTASFISIEGLKMHKINHVKNIQSAQEGGVNF